MMTPRITSRDWQAISEYLDGRLDTKTRLNLEKRVQSDPELQTAMDEMRRTRMVIRSQPVRKAPRSFKLTRAMVGVPAAVPPRSYYALRLASLAVVALLLVVVFGDFMTHSSLSPGPIIQQEASLEMAEAVPPQDDAALMMKAAPAEGEAQLKSLEAANPTATPESLATPLAGNISPAGARQGLSETLTQTPTEVPVQAAEPFSEPTGTPETPLPGGETLAQYPAPAETAGQASAMVESEAAVNDQGSEALPARISPFQQAWNTVKTSAQNSAGIIRAVEFGLTLLAVVLAVGSWLIYRSVSKKDQD